MNVWIDSGLHRKIGGKVFRAVLAGSISLILLASAGAQTCQTSSDMDAATRSALEAVGKKYFGMAANGDVFSLKQNAIPSLASNFSGIETAVTDNKPNLAGAQPTIRP